MENPISLGKTLLPALMQCFGIIFLGYILGKIKVLQQTEARGLSIFVQYISLPALIFSTVSTISFSEMKWEFVASVFVSKACIFICVALITIILTHPTNLGKAGIYAISATQSNDFAIGYPLFLSLYQNTHPEFAMYLYIIAPIQLLLLNGIGFFFLEIEKQNQLDSRWRNCHVFHIFKEIFKNPVVIMTIVGLIWNLTYGQKVPPILDNILKAFSSAFAATALLLLGYTMNLSNRNSSNISLSVTLMILAKNLILPILLQKFTAFMLQNHSNKEIQSYSSFGFLYGTIPIAPSVYVFATQYDCCVNVIAKTVIGSTLLSAPLMFSTASVISLSQIGIENISVYLSEAIAYLSIVNILCCIWLLTLFCLGKRWRNINFSVIIFLVIAQFLSSIGGLLLFSSPTKHTFYFYIQYLLTSGSIYSTRMCAVLLACLLFTIRVRSLCFILQMKKKINIISIIFCFIFPYVLAACLILNEKDNYEPSYPLGYVQFISTFVITSFALAGTIITLILQRIYSKKDLHVGNLNSQARRYFDPIPPFCCESGDARPNYECCDIEDLGQNMRQSENSEYEHIGRDIDINVCDSNYPCSTAQRFDCSLQVSRYINENQEIGTGINDNEHFPKHIGILLALIVSMTLSLSVCFWKMIMEAINGVFIELEFLDVIINYSLGIFFFIMFGFDKNLINIICTKWKLYWNRLLPESGDIDIKFSCISEKFILHSEACKKAIAETKIINNIEYNDIFSSESLRHWILKENLVLSFEEADSYIRHLLEDHLIEKVYENNNFYKDLQFFKFTQICFSSNKI